MKSLSLLIKPVSGSCNLCCHYCFYEDEKKHRQTPNRGILSMEPVELLLRRILESGAKRVSFAFQGGEPILWGLKSYRMFVDKVHDTLPPDVVTEFSIQTNGTLVTDEWAEFFSKHHFLVGVSLDGTRSIHDLFRRSKDGEPTSKQVLHGISILQKHKVDVNLLCVVTGVLAKKPQNVYQSLKKTGIRYLQFIPCLDPLNESAPILYSLSPEQYGRFLCSLFDLWYQDWEQGNYVSIRLFDDYVHLLAGQAPGACATAGTCGSYFTLEADGSVYPCDFFVLDDYLLGHLSTHSFSDLEQAAGPFCIRGRGIPSACNNCPWVRLCRGGCQREWTKQGENKNCQAFQMLFSHAIARMQHIALLERRMQLAANIHLPGNCE